MKHESNPRCWSCGRGPEAYESKWTCPACKAHGAWRGPMPEYALEARRESTRLMMELVARTTAAETGVSKTTGTAKRAPGPGDDPPAGRGRPGKTGRTNGGSPPRCGPRAEGSGPGGSE